MILLGTGLTMIDAFLTLNALGWEGKIHAVSRNGLLPWPHFKGVEYTAFPEGDPAHLRLDELRAQIDDHCERLRGLGLNPAMLVDKLRPFTQRLWQNFNLAEKHRFLREFRTRWNVVRHRVPESIHRQLTAAIEAGRLNIVKGQVRGLAAVDGGLHLQVSHGDGGVSVLRGGAVINCTGPADGHADERSFLYHNLRDRGLVASDDLNLGIQVSPDFVAMERGGGPSPHILAIGSLLRGVLWESTAVPELRNQAFRVAEVIVAQLHAKRAEVREVAETYADVMEFSI